MTPLATRIAIATRAAFTEARAARPRERFYVYALFSESGDDLQPSCNTVEALAKRGKADADELRWAAEEFACHQLGEAHFSSLGARPLRAGIGPAVEALRALDREGFFGKGAARDEVAVLFLRSDQNHREVVEVARKLNPRAVWPRIEAAFEVAETTGKPTYLPGPEVYSLDSLTVSADGGTLAGGGWFGGAQLVAWKLSRRARRLPIERRGGEGFRAIALSPDGTTLFAATESVLRRWSLPSGKPLPSLALAGCESLCVSPDGRSLVASVEESLQRWSLDRDGEAVAAPIRRALAGPVAFSPDGKRLVGIGATGVVVLDAHTLAPLATYRHQSASQLAVSNRLVAAAGYEAGKPISIFAAHGTKSTLPGHARAGVTGLGFSADGKRLASCGEDGHVRVWDVRTKKLLSDVRGRQEAMSAVVFLPDGRVAACGRDTSDGPPVYVWPRP